MGLWPLIAERSVEAHASGALYRIESEPHYVTDQGVEFAVRLATDFARQVATMPRNRPGSNPFLPPEPALYLGDVSPTHYALLNKYHVIENHLLVVTREYVDQEVLLDLADFEALVASLPDEMPAIGFYNGGHGSGASQAHKHLQVVTLPLSPRASIPMAARIESGDLPFLHAVARLAPGEALAPRALHAAYREVLAQAGIAAVPREGREWQSAPYNLLITRAWMLLVPRSPDTFERVAINALAFAGAFFVREPEQLEAVRRLGPMNVLAHAGKPDPDPPPTAPQRPEPMQCCGRGCDPCIYDLYEDALARYERELEKWRARGSRGGGQGTTMGRPSNEPGR